MNTINTSYANPFLAGQTTTCSRKENVSTSASSKTSDASSSGSIIDAQVKALEKKISELEKEIAVEQKSAKNDELSIKNLQVKETLLASYQAELFKLEMQIAKAASPLA